MSPIARLTRPVGRSARFILSNDAMLRASRPATSALAGTGNRSAVTSYRPFSAEEKPQLENGEQAIASDENAGKPSALRNLADAVMSQWRLGVSDSMAAGLTSSTTTTTTATASEVESAVAEPIGTPGGVAVNEVSAETEVLTAAEQAWGRPYGEPLESRAETLGSLSAVECEQEEEIQDPDADQDTSPIVNLEDAAAELPVNEDFNVDEVAMETAPVDDTEATGDELAGDLAEEFVADGSEAPGDKTVRQMEVIRCWTAAQVDQALSERPEFFEHQLLGFDAEWKRNPVGLVQICTDKTALLLHMAYFDTIPASLTKLLGNPRILKGGVNVAGDALKLFRDFGLETAGLVDIAYMMHSLDMKEKGLKTAAEATLNMAISKSKKSTTSDWDRCPLSHAQTHYAVQDAWIGLATIDILYRAHGKPGQSLYDFVVQHRGLVGVDSKCKTASVFNKWPAKQYAPVDFDVPETRGRLQFVLTDVAVGPSAPIPPRPSRMAYFAHQRYLKDEATKLAKATSTEKKSAVSVMLAETTGEATQEDIAAVDEQLLADDSDSRDSLLDQDAAASECSTSEEMLDEEAADEPDFDSEAYGYTDSIRYHDHIRSQIAGLNEMKSPRATKAAASRAETAPSRGETAPSRAETAAPPAAVAGSHMEVLVKLGPKSVYHANRTLTNRVLPKVQLFNSLFEFLGVSNVEVSRCSVKVNGAHKYMYSVTENSAATDKGAADQRAVVGSLQTDDVLAWEDAVSSFVLTCPTAPAAEAIAPVDDLLKAYYAFAEPNMKLNWKTTMSVRGRFVTSVYLDDMVIAHGSELPRKAEAIYSALCAACEQLDIYDPADNAPIVANLLPPAIEIRANSDRLERARATQ